MFRKEAIRKLAGNPTVYSGEFSEALASEKHRSFKILEFFLSGFEL